MAVYISIRQTNDTTEFAEYSFSLSADRTGRLKINKTTGETELLESISNDEQNGLYSRAAHKVKKHWQNGDLPKETCWAS